MRPEYLKGFLLPPAPSSIVKMSRLSLLAPAMPSRSACADQTIGGSTLPLVVSIRCATISPSHFTVRKVEL